MPRAEPVILVDKRLIEVSPFSEVSIQVPLAMDLGAPVLYQRRVLACLLFTEPVYSLSPFRRATTDVSRHQVCRS